MSDQQGDLADSDQPPRGGFGQLRFVDKGKNQWGAPTGGQDWEDGGLSLGSAPRSNFQGAPKKGAAPSKSKDENSEDKRMHPQAVELGNVNPAFVGDDNKTPVCSAHDGRAVISHEHVVKTDQDGIRVVVTSRRQTWRDEKVVREKDLKLLRIFSIISIILFFPTGIPAFYYAKRTYIEFHTGIIRGELDTARKMAKRCEKLIILSVMGALLIAVLTFVIVENKMYTDDGNTKFQDNTFGRRTP